MHTSLTIPAPCGLRVSVEPPVQTAAYLSLIYNMFGAQPLIKDPQSSINLRVSHQPFIYSLLSLRPTHQALTLKWMRWRDGGLLYTRGWIGFACIMLRASDGSEEWQEWSGECLITGKALCFLNLNMYIGLFSADIFLFLFPPSFLFIYALPLHLSSSLTSCTVLQLSLHTFQTLHCPTDERGWRRQFARWLIG